MLSGCVSKLKQPILIRRNNLYADKGVDGTGLWVYNGKEEHETIKLEGVKYDLYWTITKRADVVDVVLRIKGEGYEGRVYHISLKKEEKKTITLHIGENNVRGIKCSWIGGGGQ